MLTTDMTRKLRDRHLKVDIESALLELELLPGEHIEVDVRNQGVTLMGEVYTGSMKYLAEYEVMSFPLAKNIMNLIHVHSPPVEAHSIYEDYQTSYYRNINVP
ncbi:MAG: BON domain-containing protein [Bdellovibrionales bacterium]|nr:BON domain-containing protein [Bdellovibrionales bacterium]